MNIKTKVPKVSGATKFSNCFQVRPSRDRQNTEILQDVSNEVSGARLSIYISNRICVRHIFQTRHSMNNFKCLGYIITVSSQSMLMQLIKMTNALRFLQNLLLLMQV